MSRFTDAKAHADGGTSQRRATSRKPRRKVRTMRRDRRKQAIRDLSVLNGLPPYDDGGNICRGDGYFAQSLVRKYGMPLDELSRVSGFDKVLADWRESRSKFLEAVR